MIFVTGGAGFIGSNFILDWLAQSAEPIVNFDKLTYAGNLHNLATLLNDPRHIFVQGDIGDAAHVGALLARYQPRAILHFAAESHVDRSIHSPSTFVSTNVNGTFALLEAAHAYWSGLAQPDKASFRLLHVSTDEVYGTLGPLAAPFSETTPYAPNSPYSASKAAADHLVRAYHRTYKMPTLTTHCSNNYGPYHFPEKLIPLIIANARAGKALPIYGDGLQVRDWLYVADHCDAIRRVLSRGRVGEVYNIGGGNEMTNLALVQTLCDLLDQLDPKAHSYRAQITHVQDRPGHDRRYAIDARKIAHELDWVPAESFDTGIRKTVEWYLNNDAWLREVQSGAYLQWGQKNHPRRSAQERFV